MSGVCSFYSTGHETTATTLAWALFSLSNKPSVQSRLRDEIVKSFQDESAPATLDDLNALPYLEAVVRETLRFHATVEILTRLANEDDVIPMGKSFVDAEGKHQDHLR